MDRQRSEEHPCAAACVVRRVGQKIVENPAADATWSNHLLVSVVSSYWLTSAVGRCSRQRHALRPPKIELRLVRSRVETPMGHGMQRAALGIGRTLLSGTERAERNTAAGVLPLARPPPSRAIGNSHRRPIIKAKLSQEANRFSRILEEDSCPADAGDVFTRTAQQRTRTGTSRRSLAWVIKVGAVWSALDVGLWTNFGGVVVM